MPRFNYPKNSFLAGELSPVAHGRTDLPQHQHGCKRAYNMIGLVAGGMRNREGTILDTVISYSTSRVIYFKTSADTIPQQFVLSNLKIEYAGGNTIFDAGGSATTTSPFTTATLKTLRTFQIGDVMWIFHPTIGIYRLALRTPGNYYWTKYDILPGYTAQNQCDANPFRTANTTAITITPSATTGSGVTLTASSAIFAFAQNGAIFRLNQGGTEGWARVNNPILWSGLQTTCTVDVLVNFASTAATSDWAESAWSPYRGYPRAATIFGDRVCWGGNDSQGDTIWFSKTASYYTMQTPRSGVVAADANQVTLNTPLVSKIQWMAAKERLLIGTEMQEGSIDSLSSGTSGFGYVTRSAHGSAYVDCQQAFNAVLFVDRSGTKVREMIYDYTSASYVCDDLSFWSDHLPGKSAQRPASIQQMYWQASESILWCCDDRGGLFSMTRDRKQGLSTWSHHELGGTGTTGTLKPLVNSLSPQGYAPYGYDVLYLNVTRSVNSSPVYTLEGLNGPFKFDSITDSLAVSYRSCVYLDCAVISNSGSPVSSVSVNSSFNGETFGIFGDGFYLGTAVVSSGSLALPSSATQVVVGYPIRALVEPLSPEAGSAVGSAQGSIKRVDRVQMRFYRTLGAKFGRDTSNLESINFRTDSMAMDTQIPFFTGEKVLPLAAFPDTDPTVVVVQDLPFPMTLCSLAFRGDTHD